MASSPDTDARDRERQHARSTAKHSAVYLIGTALSRVAGLIMLPLYTRVLSTREYGVMELLGFTTDIISMLVGLGIGTAVTRHYYRYDNDDERRAVISSAAVMLLAMFVAVGAVGMLTADPLSRLLLGPEEPAVFVRLAMVALVLGVTIEVPMIVLRARQKSVAVVTAGLTRLGLALTFNVIFVVILRLGVAGVFYSTIISSAVVGGYLLITLLRETGVRFVPALARQLILFGAPLVVWEVGSFVLHFSDRFFLRAYASLAVVGIYSLSYKLAIIIPFFVTGPFGQIWLPKALEVHRKEGAAAIPILASLQRYYSIALISVSLGLTLFSPDVVRIVADKAFYGAAGPIPVLALAMVFFGYRQVAQVGALIAEQPGVVARATAIAAVGVLVLNFLFIPRWGAMGAAVATLGGFALDFFLIRWYSMRLYPLRIYIGVLPIALAAAAWWLGQVLAPPDAGLVPSILGHAAAFLAFVIALFATGIITPTQRRSLAEALRNPVATLRALRAS
ncbi:MAG: oligosaccharide flippase family protein [Gemmatimonadaceae bacterium]|nr:oligosaccharide flippase family protein [Gemmatimonadaceae bacterium]